MASTDTHVYTPYPRIRMGHVGHRLSFTREHASIMTALYAGLHTNREIMAPISYFDRYTQFYTSSEKSWPRYLTLQDFTQVHKSAEKSQCLTLRNHYASTGIFRELETYRTVFYLAVVAKAVEVSGVARVTFVRALFCHVIQNNTLQLVRFF